jgi:hypothetical protein
MEKKNRISVMIFSIAAAVLFVIAVLAIVYIVLENDKPDNMVVEQEADADTDTGIKVDFETDELAKEINKQDLDMIIGGYQFTIPSDYDCMYVDDIGPVIYQPDVFQMRLVVKGRPYDEVCSDSESMVNAITEKGAVVLQEMQQIEINGNPYTYLKIDLEGDEMLVCYGDVPDHLTHLGGQIVIQSNSVSDEELLHMFASIAETAMVTDEPDTTQEDVNLQQIPSVEK